MSFRGAAVARALILGALVASNACKPSFNNSAGASAEASPSPSASTGTSGGAGSGSGTAAASPVYSLAFSVQPVGGVAVGVALATQPTVRVLKDGTLDATRTDAITLAVFSDSTCSTAVSGGIRTLAVAGASKSAVAGVAAFTNVNVTKPGTVYLQASAAGVSSACSSAVSLTIDLKTKLGFFVQPSSAPGAGTSFPIQPVVEIQDQYGNRTTDTDSVTLAAYDNAGCSTTAALTGVLGTTLGVSAVAGAATYTNINYTKAEALYLKATSGTLASACSSLVSVVPGTATKLSFTTQPGGPATAGSNFTQPVVKVLDANNNTVTSSTATITLEPFEGNGGCDAGEEGTNSALRTNTVTGVATLAATAGVATFANINYTKTATLYLKASSGALTTACSTGSVAVSAAAAAKLAYTTQPSGSVAAGANFTQPVVRIYDTYDNLRTGDTDSITLSAYLTSDCSTTAGGGSVRLNTTTPLGQPAVGGIATFTNANYTKAEVIYLRATTGSLTSACSTSTVTVSAAVKNKLGFTAIPTNVDKNVNFSPQPILEIQDSFGNRTTDTDSVTLAPVTSYTNPTTCSTSPTQGTLSGTLGVAASSGSATFAGLNFTQGAKIYLRATSGALTVACSTAIIVRYGTWSPMATASGPSGLNYFGEAWTGAKWIIWGGHNGTTFVNTGASYDLAGNAWTPLPTTGAPPARGYLSGVWTGTKAIFWGGGQGGSGYLDTGGVFDLSGNIWTPTSVASVPSMREKHTAVYTGGNMFVFGGETTGGVVLNSGGIYNVAGNTWSAMSAVGAPVPRSEHQAVLAGSNMVVWGGRNGATNYNSGGVYATGGNTWTPTQATGAPSPRVGHSMVYTGTGNDKVIVWGGYDSAVGGSHTNSGGVYNVAGNSWTTMSVADAPVPRRNASAIWTGFRMLLWGGLDVSDAALNNGGLYVLSLDSWGHTALGGVPSSRSNHRMTISAGATPKVLVWGEGSTGGLLDPGLPCPSTTSVYSTATSGTSYVVPEGCNSVTVKVWGAAGGSGYSCSQGGGGGGFVSGVVSTTPGETLTVMVGGGGQAGTSGAVGSGGLNGGGNGFSGSCCSYNPSGGGGYSAVKRAASFLLLAGGGGGSSNSCPGGPPPTHGGGSGSGGGGAAGGHYYGGGGCGGGGTGGSGGSAGTDGNAGSYLQGGSGTNGTNTGGGGGGGGYYGGGSGRDCGGGGSGYIDGSVTSTTSLNASGTTSAGNGDGNWQGNAGNVHDTGEGNGHDGLVVIVTP